VRTDDPFATLAERADRLGVSLDPAQVEVLRRHFDLVLARNAVVNLTRITDPGEAVGKLYLASLAAIPALHQVGIFTEGLFRGLDIGTGAGYPGIPLAVAAPHARWTLIDARRKKVAFLREALEELGLDRVEAVHSRARDLPALLPDAARGYDFVTARAVASAEEIVAEAAGLLVPGGVLVVYKGPNLSDGEVARGREAAERHGLRFLVEASPRVEELAPRLLVFSAWSARDEGEYDE
jgi:16S rRNA (guanine527-N7)-methyltransferase